jgi:hypothetical protein
VKREKDSLQAVSAILYTVGKSNGAVTITGTGYEAHTGRGAVASLYGSEATVLQRGGE